MDVFWDEQLEVESDKTLSVCQGAGARGRSATSRRAKAETVQKPE